MSNTIAVKAKRAHENAFGDALVKKVGDEYDAPPYAAQGLKAQGLVGYVDAKAARETLALHGVPDEPAEAAPVKA